MIRPVRYRELGDSCGHVMGAAWMRCVAPATGRYPTCRIRPRDPGWDAAPGVFLHGSQSSPSAEARPRSGFVLTWLSTASGGAERSIAELAAALHAKDHAVHVILWDMSGRPTGEPVAETHPFEMTRVDGLAGYRRVLVAALRSPAVTTLLSTHRTAAVDLSLARDSDVLIIPVLRALLLPHGHLRMVAPVSGDLVATAPHRMDWNLFASAGCWVGVSAAATASLLRAAPKPLPVATIDNGVRSECPPLRTPGQVQRLAVVARLEGWKRVDRVISAFLVRQPPIAS